MKKTLSIRELTRSGKILLNYDYIDIEDKKSHRYKGVFVPKQYADEVKQFIEEKLLKEKNEKKKILMEYAGIAKGDIGERRLQDLKGTTVEQTR